MINILHKLRGGIEDEEQMTFQTEPEDSLGGRGGDVQIVPFCEYIMSVCCVTLLRLV